MMLLYGTYNFKNLAQLPRPFFNYMSLLILRKIVAIKKNTDSCVIVMWRLGKIMIKEFIQL